MSESVWTRLERYWPPTLFGVIVLVAAIVLIAGRSPSKPAEVPQDAGTQDAGTQGAGLP